MQDLLNKIDRLLKEKKFFEVKNIVKDGEPLPAGKRLNL